MAGLLLAAAFALIIGGAILFTNAIEWSGKRLDLGEGAVGSLLAAVGTALPESLIPVVAVLSGGESEQVAIGAIVGAPFMLGTVGIGLGLIHSTSLHIAGAVGLLIAYAAYARRTVRHSGEGEDLDELESLKFDPSSEDQPRP